MGTMSNSPAADHPAMTMPAKSQGVIGQDWFATHVSARLQDFFFETAPWQRRLWDAGTLSALKELLDASFWQSQNVLSAGSVSWLATELERIVGRDHGLGGREMKKKFAAELATSVPYDSRHWRTLQQLTLQAEKNYLGRWLDAIDQPTAPGAERTARAIAGLLLDSGFSMPFLHSWIGRHISAASRLEEVFRDAEELRNQGLQEFEAVIPFALMPNMPVAEAHVRWLSAPAVSTWLVGDNPDSRTGVRQVGGFSYTLEAKDPYAAARMAAGIVDRLIARASYAPGYKRMAPSGTVWVRSPGDSSAREYPLAQPHRGTYVRSLVSEIKVHDVGVTSTSLDDALELAASLNNSSSAGPAVASGWSALEALLFSPGDPQDHKDGRGVIVAARAASLAACSWPRAELTSLAHAHNRKPAAPSHAGHFAQALNPSSSGGLASTDRTAVAKQIRNAAGNKERCDIVLSHFDAGHMLHLAGASDAAAQERVLGLIADTRGTLGDVRTQINHAFRRMYRNRNMVVHGGAANAGTLEVALRTSAPLVGAVLDRIAHAQLVGEVPPLDLAARGDISLESVHLPEGPRLTELLE